MPASKPRVNAAERLRASPNFALTFALDGRPYIAKETEPYVQYWLTERERILLSMFSAKRGASADEAVDGYFRLTRTARSAAERKRLANAIDDMCTAGVLLDARGDNSRYTNQIVEAYLTHRPFPREVSDFIIRSAGLGKASRALDLAGGPGDLALALAGAYDHVALMDLSRGFLQAAAKRAQKTGVALTAIHDSCNRLVFREEEYDVVTISQALHWLDDVLVCRGICRCLRPGGSFFVVQGAFDVDEQHPLSFVLGKRSVLGHKAPQSFAQQVQALLRRLTLLFDALDAPEVHRIDLAQRFQGQDSAAAAQIIPVGVSLFSQRRPLGVGFARAFLTPEHIAATGQTPEAFWKDVEARCASATAEQVAGTYDWGVLQFRRGGKRIDPQVLEHTAAAIIGYEGIGHL